MKRILFIATVYGLYATVTMLLSQKWFDLVNEPDDLLIFISIIMLLGYMWVSYWFIVGMVKIENKLFNKQN
jgi:hypothetical protein